MASAIMAVEWGVERRTVTGFVELELGEIAPG
jgi:hypothetical protein